MAVTIPPGGSWFDTIKRSFTDVPIGEDESISTDQFLEAADSLTTLFGKSSLNCSYMRTMSNRRL